MPIALDRTFRVERAILVNPSAGRAYAREPYSFDCSPCLVRTQANFYDSVAFMLEAIKKGGLPEDARFSFSPEVHAIANAYRKQGKDPRKAEEFRGYFGRNAERTPIFEWTFTAYRTPKGYENGRKDRNGKYLRIVIEADPQVLSEISGQITEPGFDWGDIGDRLNKEKYDIWLPEGRGMVIVEYDDFGNPVETRDIPYPHEGFDEHFWLDSVPRIDEISGHYDVAVERRGGWRHAGGERCLCVGACFERWVAGSDGGFRSVRGSVPKIEKYGSVETLSNSDENRLAR